MTSSDKATNVVWRRLRYLLSPQWDIYQSIGEYLKPTDRVLEIGFGTGAGVLQYVSSVLSVNAIEIDTDAVDFAISTFPHPSIFWSLNDITEGDYPPVYDIVIAIETLEHIPEWRKALRNIAWSLRPKGQLIISARNKNADLRRWKDLHEREWTAKEFRAALRPFFREVHLYDYTLQHLQGTDTALTPLIAIATK